MIIGITKRLLYRHNKLFSFFASFSKPLYFLLRVENCEKGWSVFLCTKKHAKTRAWKTHSSQNVFKDLGGGWGPFLREHF